MSLIESIEINNFKSHRNFKENLKKQNHIIIYGKNGVGKTNLLESLSYFSNTKGLRGDAADKVFPKGNDQNLKVAVNLNFISNNQKYKASYEFENTSDKIIKTYYLDQKKTTLSNIKKYLNFVWLSPYMDKIMYEGNSIKRNFIDKLISQNNTEFAKILSSYKKNLTERLSILKNSKDEKWLSIIEQKIAEEILLIFIERRKYAKNLNELIVDKLSNFRSTKIVYRNDIYDEGLDKEETINQLIKILYSNRHLDELTKRTSFSISSDEIYFFDIKNNLNTDSCSTGEQKSSLVTIILANCWMMKIKNNQFIILLDEATSHIDEKNFEHLVVELEKFETQIWYTGTGKKMFQVIENKGFFIELS